MDHHRVMTTPRIGELTVKRLLLPVLMLILLTAAAYAQKKTTPGTLMFADGTKVHFSNLVVIGQGDGRQTSVTVPYQHTNHDVPFSAIRSISISEGGKPLWNHRKYVVTTRTGVTVSFTGGNQTSILWIMVVQHDDLTGKTTQQAYNIFDSNGVSISKIVFDPGSMSSNSTHNSSDTPTATEYFSNKGVVMGMVNDDEVNVRAKASLTSPVMARVNRGAEATVIGRSASKEKVGSQTHYWYEVRLASGKDGYIYGQFIDLDRRKFDRVATPDKTGSLVVNYAKALKLGYQVFQSSNPQKTIDIMSDPRAKKIVESLLKSQSQ